MKVSKKTEFILLIALIIGFLEPIVAFFIGYPYLFCIFSIIFFSLIFIVYPHLFNIKYLLPTSVFIFSYIFVIFIPALFIYYQNRGLNFSSRYMVSTSSVLIFVPIGILVGNLFFKVSKREVDLYQKSTILLENEDRSIKIFFILLSFFSFLILIYYLKVSPTLPLFEALKNPHNFRFLMQLREESLKLLNVPTPFLYIFRWLPTILFPSITMISYYIYLIEKTKLWVILFSIFLIVSLFVSALTLAKLPVVFYLLTMGVFFYLMSTNKKIFSYIFISLSAISSFLLTYIVSFEELGVYGVIKGLFLRFFYTPSFTVFQYFEVFPGIHDFLYGRAMKWYCFVFHKDFFNAANYVYRIYFPERLESGLINTCFVGESYANFGFYGVIIEAVILGLILSFLNYMIIKVLSSKSQRTIHSIVFQSILFPMSIIILNSSPITSFLLTGGLIPLVLLVFLFKRWDTLKV